MYGLPKWRILSVKKMLRKSRGYAGAGILKEMPLEIRRKEARKPLFLTRYE
jgi:hypothetical protein